VLVSPVSGTRLLHALGAMPGRAYSRVVVDPDRLNVFDIDRHSISILLIKEGERTPKDSKNIFTEGDAKLNPSNLCTDPCFF
jgi:hypothetical protein